MDHMVDLDQALNELERQESEELLKKNKKTEQVSIDTNELSSTSLSEVKLSIEQNNCLISLSEIIENDTVSNKQQAILESELESELNDIMQSLIMDEKSLSKKELIIIEHEKITIEHKTVLLDERPEEFPVIDEFEKNVDVTPIEYVNSIGEDYSTRKSEPVHSDPIKKEEKIQETMDEIFSSPNEDSECYFDTIEANSTALDPESAEKTSNNLETVKPEEIVHSLESLDDLNKTDLLCLSASNSETLTQIEETNPITPTFDTMNETPISESDTNESLDHSTNTIEPAAINQDLSNDLVAITETAYMEATHHETDNSETTNSQTSAECQQPEQQTPDENRIPIEVTDYQTEWSDLTESEKTLGLIAPAWMPDPETDVCLKCSTKFSFRTRRHHCRACGLIFCSKCCYLKISLPYIVNKSNSTNINNNMNENTENEKPTLATKSEMSRCCNGCYEVITKGNTPIVSVLKKKSASVNQMNTLNKLSNNGLTILRKVTK